MSFDCLRVLLLFVFTTIWNLFVINSKMPFKCCVTGCSSNYKNTDDQHVTIYKCPKQSVELWKSKIPRKDIIIDANSRVCIKHFDERFLIREYVFTGSDGKKYSEQRKFPKLTADAYPSIFPNLPSYLSESLPSPRKTPDQRRAEIDERDNSILDEYLSCDCIASRNAFASEIRGKLQAMDEDDLWNVTTKDQVMYIFNFDYSQAYLRIATSVLVFDDMSVKLYCYDKDCTRELSSMLGNDLQLKRWSQFM